MGGDLRGLRRVATWSGTTCSRPTGRRATSAADWPATRRLAERCSRTWRRYTLAFAPALIWLSDAIGAWAVATAALISSPHLIQDDGRLLTLYMVRAKHTDGASIPAVAAAVDQTFHVLALFLTALLVGE